MTKAEEYVIACVVGGGDQAEYVSKEDALKAVEIARREAVESFSRLFGGVCTAICGFEFDSQEGGKLNIEIIGR